MISPQGALRAAASVGHRVWRFGPALPHAACPPCRALQQHGCPPLCPTPAVSRKLKRAQFAADVRSVQQLDREGLERLLRRHLPSWVKVGEQLLLHFFLPFFLCFYCCLNCSAWFRAVRTMHAGCLAPETVLHCTAAMLLHCRTSTCCTPLLNTRAAAEPVLRAAVKLPPRLPCVLLLRCCRACLQLRTGSGATAASRLCSQQWIGLYNQSSSCLSSAVCRLGAGRPLPVVCAAGLAHLQPPDLRVGGCCG